MSNSGHSVITSQTSCVGPIHQRRIMVGVIGPDMRRSRHSASRNCVLGLNLISQRGILLIVIIIWTARASLGESSGKTVFMRKVGHSGTTWYQYCAPTRTSANKHLGVATAIVVAQDSLGAPAQVMSVNGMKLASLPSHFLVSGLTQYHTHVCVVFRRLSRK